MILVEFTDPSKSSDIVSNKQMPLGLNLNKSIPNYFQIIRKLISLVGNGLILYAGNALLL